MTTPAEPDPLEVVNAATPPRSRPRIAAPAPDRLAPEAFHGLIGEIVRAVMPTTEADEAGVLVSLLVTVGNMLGPGVWWSVSGTRHPAILFATLVGATGEGRKGTAGAAAGMVPRNADFEWAKSCIASGLSSGEGLMDHIRDPIYKMEPIRENKKSPITGYEQVLVDAGVDDKRLLVIESEFGSVLKAAERSGNTITAVLRQAWDGTNLRTLTRNSPLRVTGPHVSILGHITAEELHRLLSDTDAANGFGNRFMWICVSRSKLLPDGGDPDPTMIAQLGSHLYDVLNHRCLAGLVTRTPAANRMWRDVYASLSSGAAGLYGAITGRAEVQVLRMAMIYAALDGSEQIDTAHLLAALAVWDYADQSARHLFGTGTGNAMADDILAALRERGPLDRTAIRQLTGNAVPAGDIESALRLLQEANAAASTTEQTGGRPREVWTANPDLSSVRSVSSYLALAKRPMATTSAPPVEQTEEREGTQRRPP